MKKTLVDDTKINIVLLWMSIGLGIGAIVSLFMNDILFMCIGMLVGVMVGLFVKYILKRKPKNKV